MNRSVDSQEHPIVVIHNITTLTVKQVEQYLKKYDKNIHCFRKKNRNNHQYILALFTSITSVKNFLNDRPHFIENCRIK